MNVRDNTDWSPLHFASQQGHLRLVRLLLDHDTDVLARNHEDRTFLDVAWASGHKEIINVDVDDLSWPEPRDNRIWKCQCQQLRASR